MAFMFKSVCPEHNQSIVFYIIDVQNLKKNNDVIIIMIIVTIVKLLCNAEATTKCTQLKI